MGPTIKNLKSLLRMPTGCGEQTMTSLAPDVFVYNYLRKTNKLNQDIAEKALNYMYKGTGDLQLIKSHMIVNPLQASFLRV